MLIRQTLVFTAVFAIGLNAQSRLQLHVSSQPDASPCFQSLEQARDAIREMKAAGELPVGGVMVNIHGGTYPVHDTFELGREDAGLPGRPVVYRACEGEEVVFSGGQQIAFEKFSTVCDPKILARLIPEARTKIVCVNLFELGITDPGEIKQQGFSTPILSAHLEVYGDGRRFELAQWPDEGSLPVGNVLDPGANPFDELHGGVYQDPALINPDYTPRGGTFEFDYERASRWKQADSIWLRGVFSRGFAHDNLKVKNIDFGARTITTGQPHMFSIEPWGPDNPKTQSRRYVVYNLLEELDRPGEYYLDKNTGTLYLIPFEGEPLESIEVTRMEKPFIAIENTAHIQLSGITLEYGRGMGIYMENSEDVVLDSLTVRCFGTLGIMMGQGVKGGPEGPVHEFTGTPVSRHVGNIKAHQYENSTWDRRAGRNCTIQNCRIYNTGQGGVILDGGSRIDLSPGNNKIINCELRYNSNLRKSYSPAVSVYGVANAVRNCHIYDQPHNAITLFGNDHAIEYNEIDHILQEEFDDMGAFYMGRNPSEMGHMIRCNYFHDIGADDNRRTTGVYLDDGAGGALIASNIFYKAGSFGSVYLHFGHRNTIENNVFVDCRIAGRFFLNTIRWNSRKTSALWKKRLYEDIDISLPPYSTRYPNLPGYLNVTSRTNRVRSNILINCGEGFTAQRGKGGVEADGDFVRENNRSETADLSEFNLEMLNNGPLADLLNHTDGFKAIPVDQIGLLHREQQVK
jgi:hypothetical protein